MHVTKNRTVAESLSIYGLAKNSNTLGCDLTLTDHPHLTYFLAIKPERRW